MNIRGLKGPGSVYDHKRGGFRRKRPEEMSLRDLATLLRALVWSALGGGVLGAILRSLGL